MTSRSAAVLGFLAAVTLSAAFCVGESTVHAASWGLWNDPHGDIVKPVPRPAPETPPVVLPKADASAVSAPVAEKTSEAAVAAVDSQSSSPTVEASSQSSSEGAAPANNALATPVGPEAVVAVSPDAESVSPASTVVEPAGNTATVSVVDNPVSLEARQPVAAVLPAEPIENFNEVSQSPAVSQLPGDAYVIGAGDVLDIAVWRDESLTKSVVVLPDGTISFPLIGVVTAGGRTVEQLKEEIRTRLSSYFSDLTLSLEVRQANSMMIFVVGKVNSPGRHPISAPVNVLQALAMAGGVNPFAKKDDIKIFRQEEGKTVIYPFAYSEVSRGNRLEENIILKRGDLIVVP